MSLELVGSAGAGPPAVATRGLVKRYGDVVALNGVDLHVPEGAVYVLAGSNGSGKTTLIESLLDLHPVDDGTAEVFGLDCRRNGARVRAQIGYVASRPEWGYSWMTVRQLLRHHASFYPSWDAAYADELAAAFALPLDRPVRALSRGFGRRVQILTALAHRPPLLLLDEPTEGLDRVVRDELLGILAKHLSDSPTTILISTHQIYEVESLADALGVLHEGRLTVQVSREALHQRLRRYRAEVPNGWRPPAQLEKDVVARSDSEREIRWIVWGEEARVAGHLGAAGATLREITPLSLDDAVLALLRWDGARDARP